MTRKPRQPARIATMYREQLTNEFLSHYDSNKEFFYALVKVIKKHRPSLELLRSNNPQWLTDESATWPTLMWIIEEEGQWSDVDSLRKLRDDLTALARKWGLHTLPDDIGCAAVLSVCVRLVEAKDGYLVPIDTPDGYVIPVPTREGHRLRPDNDPGEPLGLRYTGPHNVPYVRIDNDTAIRQDLAFEAPPAWDLRNETPGQVRERLRKHFEQLDREVTRISDQMIDDGYTFPPDSEKRSTYMEWLYRRVAYRESLDVIASRSSSTPDYVKKHIRMLAGVTGINLNDL